MASPMIGAKSALTSAKNGSGKSDSEQEPQTESFRMVFSAGSILNGIMSWLDFKDIKNVQLTSKKFNELIVWHTPTWRNRQVRITDLTVKELKNRMITRVWKAARVGDISVNLVPELRYIWSELEQLTVSSQDKQKRNISVLTASALLRHALPLMSNLKVLAVRAEFFCAGTIEDLQSLEIILTNLTQLEILHATSHAGPACQGLESFYNFKQIGVGGEEKAKSAFTWLSTINWRNLETFKMGLVDMDTAPAILVSSSSTLLQKVRHLKICTTRCKEPDRDANLGLSLWNNKTSIPNLKSLTIGIRKAVEVQQCINLGSFLSQQPLLQSLTILGKDATIPAHLLDMIAARSSQLKRFHLECHAMKAKIASLSGFFSGLQHLRDFVLKTGPTECAALDLIIDYLPVSVLHFSMDYVVVVRINQKLKRYTTGHDVVRERRAREKIPNLKTCTIKIVYENPPPVVLLPARGHC